jgi:hypothetical protein
MSALICSLGDEAETVKIYEYWIFVVLAPRSARLTLAREAHEFAPVESGSTRYHFQSKVNETRRQAKLTNE